MSEQGTPEQKQYLHVWDLNEKGCDHFLALERKKPLGERNMLLIRELRRQKLRLVRPPDAARIMGL